MNVNSEMFKKSQKLENIKLKVEDEGDIYLINLCIWSMFHMELEYDELLSDYGLSIVELVYDVSFKKADDMLDKWIEEGKDEKEFYLKAIDEVIKQFSE